MTDPLDEHWKPVVGFPNYEVSNLGRVRNRNGYVLKLKFDRRCDYYLACLSAYPKVHERAVHQLVMHAFVGPQAKGIEVRHLNGIATDNRVTNLAYGTKADNMQDAIRHGTFPVLEQRPGSKLTRAQAIEIYTSSEKTSVLERRYGIGKGVVRQIKTGETWRSVTIGLPSPTWNFKPRFTGEQLAILHDRTLSRSEVMALLDIALHQVKYFRKRHPVIKQPFAARFSAAQWATLCDRAIPASNAASRIGVSLSYVSSVRRKHGQGVAGDHAVTGREQQGGAKLTRQEAIEIYTSIENPVVLAKRYCVTPGAIRRIKIGESWRSVTISLPSSIWNATRKLTDAELRIVRDRSLRREQVMVQLNLTLNQVEYWRGLDPVPRPAFRERFTEDQWRIAGDSTISVKDAAKQLGVSNSYIKTVRARQLKVGSA